MYARLDPPGKVGSIQPSSSNPETSPGPRSPQSARNRSAAPPAARARHEGHDPHRADPSPAGLPERRHARADGDARRVAGDAGPGLKSIGFHTSLAVEGTPPAGRNLPSLGCQPQDPGRLLSPGAPEGRQTRRSFPSAKSAGPAALGDLLRTPHLGLTPQAGQIPPCGRGSLNRPEDV